MLAFLFTQSLGSLLCSYYFTYDLNTYNLNSDI